MTTVACDFDYYETKHVSHYTYAIAKVVLNTSVQIVITLYSDADSRWVKNIIFVLEGEEYSKWTDDGYITEVVAKKIAEFMPPPPPPVVVEEEVLPPIAEEVVEEVLPPIAEEVVEEILPPIAEEVVEEVKETPRDEVVEDIKKVSCKKAAARKKKVVPKCPILISPTH
jgi:hypothetical protein